MTISPSIPNPFIGPRSFEMGEKLFGRDREVRDLSHLLIAERIVLLYSPSGAGKSSLIKAALIPALEKKDFAALPPIRVNQELPPDSPPDANRYVYSTLLSLEQRFAPEERLPLGQLVAFDLNTYLQQRLLPPIRAAGHDPVLLFDQFEEVLTADLTNVDAKHTFFAQLGEALSDRHLWALFAMREDYVTALDPYLVPIPNRFKDTFRLDLLGVDAARQAVQGPAKAVGVTFSTMAATRLADDLRRTRVQCADGSSQEVLGPHVEPVQLQVVCLRLWEQRFTSDSSRRKPVITPDDITDVGDVDSALAGYYTDRVQAVAAATGVKERVIRDWFDDELITPQGRRSQVMREAGRSAGLDNRAIMGLIDAHLVRGDERHGTVWFELAHDRLAAPIQQNNAAWRMATLTPFQRQAMLWEAQGRSDRMLLEGAELAEGERWAEANAAELTEEERAFLDACRKAHAIRRQQERSNKRIRLALIAVGVAGLMAAGLAAFAFDRSNVATKASIKARQEGQRAEQEARLAQLRAFAAQSLSDQEQAPERSLLLAVAAQHIDVPDLTHQAVSLNTLLQGLQRIGGRPLRAHDGPVTKLIFSPDGGTLISSSDDGTVRLWPMDALDTPPITLHGHKAAITALALSPDGRLLAAGGKDATVRLWRLATPSAPPMVLRGHTGLIGTLAFSPDGHTLATGSDDHTARLWRLDTPDASPVVLRGHTNWIRTLAFSPDGRVLATGSNDSTALLWRLDTLNAPPTVLRGHKDTIWRLAFSPDGRTLATGSNDTTIRLWHLDAPGAPFDTLRGHTDWIEALAFSPDGRLLASSSNDTTTRLWHPDTPDAPPTVLRGHEGWVNTVIFSPDGRTLASSSNDSTVRLWSLSGPDTPPVVLRGHEDTIGTVAFSPDGHTLATGGADQTVRLWHLDTENTLPTILRAHTGWINSLAFSPDGHTLASGSSDTTLRLWSLDYPTITSKVLRTYDHPITAVAFSPDGRTLATASRDKIIHLWSLNAPDSPPVVLSGHTDTIWELAFSPDGRTLASSSSDKTIHLWHLDRPGSTPTVLTGHENNVTAVAFSPDGHTLASGSKDTSVRLWDLDAPVPTPRILRGHGDTIWTVAFSPDGDTLASGSEDSTARLWHLKATHTPSTVLRGHKNTIWTLAFSPDRHTLATGSADQTVQLWDLHALGNPPIVLRGHEGDIITLAFSPDGGILATGSEDTTVRLWRLDRKELVQLACAIAGRNFSLDEWQNLYDATTPYHKMCLRLPLHPSVYQELLVHGQFGLALLGYQEDRSVGSITEEPAAWLTRHAASMSKDRPVQSVLIYQLARWRDPQLRSVRSADLAALCQAGADKAPTPPLLDACNRALAGNPTDPYLMSRRGKLRAQLGDAAGALTDLRTAQRLAEEQKDEDTLKDIQHWISALKTDREPPTPTSTTP